MDLIEVLPPGLYEMILEKKKTEDVGADVLPGDSGAAILTCHWHRARFDLASGCTFDLWTDDCPDLSGRDA